MPSKLVKLQSIFVLILFFCTSAAQFTFQMYPTAAEKNDIRTYVGAIAHSDYNHISRDALILQAKEKRTSLRQEVKGDLKPTTVSALAVDGKIYFASSAKGSGNGDICADPKLHLHNIIKDALKKSGDIHYNDKRCGEIMVIAYWYRENPGQKLIKAKFKRIIAVDKGGAKEPCTAGDRGENRTAADYGCENFLTEVLKEEARVSKLDPDRIQACGLGWAKRNIGGGAYSNKACATKSGSGKQPPKKATATPGKQPPKKASPGKQPPKKATATPGKQPPKKASPGKQPPKRATATPRKQVPRKPSTARKHRRSMR